MKPEELFPLVKRLTEVRSEVVLQAFGDHLPMHPAAAIALLSPFFGGQDAAIKLVAQGLSNGCIEFWSEGQRFDDVPEVPSDAHELRMGEAFVPTLHAFGGSVVVTGAPAALDPEEVEKN